MSRFDRAGFVAALGAVITTRGLSDRAASREIGTSPSTLARIRQGHLPDVDNLAAIADWAQLPLDAFVTRTHTIAPSLADDIRRTVAALRASEAAAAALRLMIGWPDGEAG